jgi:PAS domain S-box-containing protein
MANQETDQHAQRTAAAIVQSAEAAILSEDLSGTIVSWNPGAERLFGYSSAEVLGQPNSMLVPPDRRAEEAEILKRIARGEPVERYQTVRLDRTGRSLDVSLTISPVRDASGSIVGVSQIVEEVSEQRRAQEASARLAAIVESSDAAIIGKDLRGVVQSWNGGAERIFGYTAAEAIGRSILMLFPPDRHAEEADILARIARGERVERFETIRIGKDGRPIDISVTVSPVLDASGRVVGASKIAQDITAQKRLEDARAELAAIVESSVDAIISKNLQGTIRSWNQGAERIFGYTAEEIIGKPVTILIPAERQAEERYILGRIARGERVEHYETVRVTKYGRAIDVALTISPVRNRAGEIVGASKVVRDISERKKMEREIAVQRERYRVTLSSVGDGVISSDIEGRVTFLNGVAERLTGWSSAEAIGQPLADVFHIISEKTRERVENPAQKVLRSGAILGLANHTALITKGGTERPIADSAAPIFDEGKIIGVVLTFRDITEERRAEEALHEQREWFEQTLQSIGDGVIATDIRGHVVFMNPVAEYLTGRTLADSLGASCAEVFRIINEKSREEAENPVGRVLREGKVVGLANHTILIDAQGNERFIDDSGAPIRNASGRIVGAVLVFRDVTERRRAEVERASAASERERLLESERAARNEAERANRVKDDFVATLSHELRTPLNAILGWTQILKAQPSREDLIPRGIDVIERNTRVQAQLVADLLDMSRIMSGKLSLEMRRADLPAIVEAAMDTIQPAAQVKGVAIHAEIDRTIGPMAGDSARLQQIVWNLLSNAVKFTPEGGRVDVRVERLGDQAHVIVRDTGIGIHPDFLPAIFERFRQADSATNRRFGGLGLGLAIVKELAQLHGGAVEATSDGEGEGTTFRVRLPMGEADGRPDASLRGSAESRETASSGEEAGLRDLRILIVEDDADAADLLERFLRNAGADVTAVRSAAAALERIQETSPDLLVSDIGMPGMDGYDLIRQVRKLEPNRGGMVPAIAVTAFARPEDRMRALVAGYQAHLAKPIDVEELVATARTLSSVRRRTTTG